jgi:hypothetical protein
MSRRGSTKGDTKQESEAKAAEGNVAAAGPGEAEIPERLEYAGRDPLHGKITGKIKEMATDLYERAVENPNSEANEMVRILLLNQIAHMQPETYQQEPKMTITEERRRGAEVKDKEEVNRRKGEQFELAKARHTAEMRKLNAQIQNLETEGRQKEMKLQQAQRVVDQALAQAEHGQAMDHMTIYNKIAEVIGLRPPAGQQMPVGSGQ